MVSVSSLLVGIVAATRPRWMEDSARRTPLVLWHGMGASTDSMEAFRVPKGMYVHIIKINLQNEVSTGGLNCCGFSARQNVYDPIEDDIQASYFGDLLSQIDYVCDTLKNDPNLSNGFNAVGFSQGGLFMRVLVQRCDAINVKTLITFGSYL
jgi:palmitoyl-protein thioesterase